MSWGGNCGVMTCISFMSCVMSHVVTHVVSHKVFMHSVLSTTLPELDLANELDSSMFAGMSSSFASLNVLPHLVHAGYACDDHKLRCRPQPDAALPCPRASHRFS